MWNEPILLGAHGGDLNGFILIKADEAKLDTVQHSEKFLELITKVGAQLCLYLKSRRANDAQGLRIVAAHIEALGLIVEHRITGAGGKLGTEMVGRLEKLVGTAQG